MVISVTETQVNPVALVIQVRMAGPRLFDEIGDALHLFLAIGSESFKTFRIVDQARFRLIRREIYKFGKNGTSIRKQVGVITRASLVPIAERLPRLTISSRAKDVAFSSQDEIRT